MGVNNVKTCSVIIVPIHPVIINNKLSFQLCPLPKIMESKRQQKFAGVIQLDLAAIFQRESANYLPNTLITITKVRVTPDLAIARIFLSFFNTAGPGAALQIISQLSSEIRYKLGARIKDQVRIIPQLEFFVDDTGDYVERMDKIFDKISREDRQPETE